MKYAILMTTRNWELELAQKIMQRMRFHGVSVLSESKSVWQPLHVFLFADSDSVYIAL